MGIKKHKIVVFATKVNYIPYNWVKVFKKYFGKGVCCDNTLLSFFSFSNYSICLIYRKLINKMRTRTKLIKVLSTVSRQTSEVLNVIINKGCYFDTDCDRLKNIMSSYPGGMIRVVSEDNKNMIITGSGGNPKLGLIEYLTLVTK